jgi:ribose transport system substrate-binding protein
VKKKTWFVFLCGMLSGVILLAACGAAVAPETSAPVEEAVSPEEEALAEEEATSTDEEPVLAEEEAVSADEEPAPAEDAGKKICISNSLASEFFVAEMNLMEKEAELYGYTVDFFDNGFDAEKQIANYEACIAQEYDLIIIQPADGNALVPVAKKAFEAGIPVINAGDRLASTADEYLVGYVGPNAVFEGRSAGELTVEALGGSGNVVEIQGAPGNPTAQGRHEGWLEVLGEHPDINVLASDTGKWDRATSQTVMENFITAYDDIDAVYCHDGGMCFGAIEAIEDAGLEDQIKVIAVNGNKAEYDAIKAGKQYGTVLNDVSFTAINSMRMTRDYFENRPFISQQESPALMITADNVEKFTPWW